MTKFFILQWKGILAGATVVGLCFGILRFTTPLFFLLSIAIWGGIVVLLFRDRLGEREMKWHIGLLVMAYIATLLLMSLTEWRLVTRIIIVLGGLTLGAFVSIIESEQQDIQVYIKKAYRRMFVMGWVYVCGALYITTYAVSVFFPHIPMFVLFVFVGSVTSVISYAVWRLYYPIQIGRFSLWLLLMAVMSMEAFWTIHLLPFGYIVLGFLATWMWYLLLLLIRFHMSAEGIRWKKQRIFLSWNAVLFVAVLFIIRWI